MDTKVYIDPACNILYASFYIKGLRALYGYKNIIFNSKPFKGLRYDNENFLLAFVINNKKYIIDPADFNTLQYLDFVEWADLYGKVNYNINNIPQKYIDKVIPIGANYGVACYGNNREINILWAIKHYLQCKDRLEYTWSSYLCRYLNVYKRKEIKNNIFPQEKKIFFISRFWEGQYSTNQYRINFIRACKKLQKEGIIDFIGGMVPDYKKNTCPQDVKLDREIPLHEYIKGIQTSTIVFNTPAYHGCHGWKLPEYLAQGAVILSTPFYNELPVALKHGENIFIAEADEDSLYNAIKLLVTNKELCKKLRKNAIRYWELYASPIACIRKFLIL
mgnify:FL=1